MSNEYKDWIIDRNADLEWCLAKAIIALQAYADTNIDEYQILNNGKIAQNAIKEIDDYLDLSTIFNKWDKNKYKENN